MLQLTIIKDTEMLGCKIQFPKKTNTALFTGKAPFVANL